MDEFAELLPENLRYTVSPPDLEGLGREQVNELADSGGRDAKNAAILSLQKAVDGRISGEIGQEEYQRIKQGTVEAITNYYSGETVGTVELPPHEFSTRQSGFLTHEAPVRHFPDQLGEYNEVDSVVPIASGGLEPGILAADHLDAEMKVVRYSKNDHGDEQPVDIEGGYQDQNLLVVDDTSYTGETLETVETHLKNYGARKVDSEAVIEGQKKGAVTLTHSYLKDFAGILR